MSNKYLPNGSIVLLEGGNKKLMIYGRKQLLLDSEEKIIPNEKETMYDYIGVPYPEGYINPEYTYVFNHSNIAKVVFKGYVDEDEEKFQTILDQV